MKSNYIRIHSEVQLRMENSPIEKKKRKQNEELYQAMNAGFTTKTVPHRNGSNFNKQ